MFFLIFKKELTNQILLPRTRKVADSAFSSEWRCVHEQRFVSFLAESGGEEQDDGFLG